MGIPRILLGMLVPQFQPVFAALRSNLLKGRIRTLLVSLPQPFLAPFFLDLFKRAKGARSVRVAVQEAIDEGAEGRLRMAPVRFHPGR